MTINNDGRFDPQDKAAILDALMADAKEKFGSDLNDDDLAVIRLFYDPVAERLAEAQIDIADVLSASQLAHAEAGALDLLCEQIGVQRTQARNATGTARFSRASAASVDYTIPSGTAIQTDSTDPIEFQTTASATLPAGETSVDVAIEAIEGGVRSNVGANTITVLKSPPTGIETVTNPADTSGGAEEETDDELRERARKELGGGSRASVPALIRGLRRVEGVKSVSVFEDLVNRTFEAVVEGGNPDEIAQEIAELKAAGSPSIGGDNGTLETGTAEYDNGQTATIEFSVPTPIQIYVDASIQVTDEYAGDEAVQNSIVGYIGGLLTSGNEEDGRLALGDDVLIGEVEYAIRDVEGVFDVTDLKVDTVSSPTGTTNIAISNGEKATSDATDSSLNITATDL